MVAGQPGRTVELHLSHVYAKLDVGSRTELVRLMSTDRANIGDFPDT
jgi:DNA-binding NarL/FixJ family response regulator